MKFALPAGLRAKRNTLVVAAGVTLVLLLGAADCETHGDADAGKTDNAPADVLQFPDGFRNVAHKCDGPNMVYSLSSGVSDTLNGAVAIAPNDPRCKTGG